MPSAKSGSPGSIVAPTAPTAPEEADQANPGQMEALKQQQREAGTGKYGSTPAKPFHRSNQQSSDGGGSDSSTETSWIEIELLDENDDPVPGEPFRITLPDGSVASGATDNKGFARVAGFDPGTCKISFPNLDQDAWS